MQFPHVAEFLFAVLDLYPQDADFGTVLEWNQQGKPTASTLKNIQVNGEVRKAESIKIGNTQCWILAKNNGAIQVLKLRSIN